VFVRSKVSCILLLILGLQLGASYSIGRYILYPTFASLEREEATKDVERCVEAIHREIRDLGQFVKDWAAWDDTYGFAEDGNSDYVRSNLVPETFVNNNLNLIYIYNSDGEVVWGEVRAPGTNNKMRLKDFPGEGVPADRALLKHESVESKVQGIWRTSGGVMLVASRPILTSAEEGPIRGTLVMGRFVGEEEIAMWRRQARVAFQFWAFEKDAVPSQEREMLDELSRSTGVVFREAGRDTLHAYTTVRGIEGRPLVLLRGDVPRQITEKGDATLFFFSVWSAAAGMVVFATLWLLLTVSVTNPLGALTQWVRGSDGSVNAVGRVGVGRGDEIGILAREFDRMVRRLAEAKRKLLDESYYSGMAEMAGGILHNIRNCLNPISGHLALLNDELAEVPLEKIERAQHELLLDTDMAPERREDLRRYVSLATRKCGELVGSARERVDGLSRSVVEMESILGHQDQLSRQRHITEDLNLQELVLDALDMVPAEVARVVSSEIAPSVHTSGPIRGYRVPLLEVLVNVLMNAHEAIVRSGTAKGRIVVTAEEEAGAGGRVIHLQVRDNGIGIEPEEVERIFERGVSSKKETTSGFGLHWCANAMRGMNGRVYAESAGAGKGAVVHLIVPRQQEEKR
jgi:two-component system, NtrC family, sensor kinase